MQVGENDVSRIVPIDLKEVCVELGKCGFWAQSTIQSKVNEINTFNFPYGSSITRATICSGMTNLFVSIAKSIDGYRMRVLVLLLKMPDDRVVVCSIQPILYSEFPHILRVRKPAAF